MLPRMHAGRNLIGNALPGHLYTLVLTGKYTGYTSSTQQQVTPGRVCKLAVAVGSSEPAAATSELQGLVVWTGSDLSVQPPVLLVRTLSVLLMPLPSMWPAPCPEDAPVCPCTHYHMCTQVSILMQGSPIQIAVSGPAGWVPNNVAVRYTVAGTDPDNPSAVLGFSWACSRDDASPCFTGSIAQQGTRAADGSWLLDPALLTVDITYTLTVTASTVDGRTATASVSFTPKVGGAGMEARIPPSCGLRPVAVFVVGLRPSWTSPRL